MKDFIDFRRRERRQEKIRNRPADWKPPTWAEISAAMDKVDFKEFYPGKTWDYESLFDK
jgi:hypothetical protein